MTKLSEQHVGKIARCREDGEAGEIGETGKTGTPNMLQVCSPDYWRLKTSGFTCFTGFTGLTLF